MPAVVGHIEALFRYPVKSMAGEPLDSATLSWHGLEGDRRLALQRAGDRGGFPFLTAGRLHDLLRYVPFRRAEEGSGDLPTHVRTPEGRELPVFGEELAAEIGQRHGAPVQMLQLKHGIFDEASISLITSATVHEIGRLAGVPTDARRFRPNILVRLVNPEPFHEDAWVGGQLTFGEGPLAPAVSVTLRDIRCAMLNLDPDTAVPAPQILKAVAHAHENTAGIYGSVTRPGRLEVGQILHFCPPTGA